MLVVLLVSGGIALLYALFPEQIVGLTLGDRYEVNGRLLGLVGVAMLLLSLANVWLNYFLSTDWAHYVYLVAIGVLIQMGLMVTFHTELWHLPAAMAANGLWLTVVGGIVFIKRQLDRRANHRSDPLGRPKP